MDFHLHSHVRRDDGSHVGQLRHVVCDPASLRVLSIVVQQAGLGGHAVVVPMDVVSGADDDSVYLRLSAPEVDRLEAYARGRDIAPPPADLDPRSESVDLPQDFIDVPDVPPIGAATGVTSIAFTPVVELERNVPEGSVILDDRTSIEASDGTFGHLTDIITDDGEQHISAVVAEHGLVFTRNVEIAADCIRGMTSDAITLSMSIADLNAEEAGEE